MATIYTKGFRDGIWPEVKILSNHLSRIRDYLNFYVIKGIWLSKSTFLANTSIYVRIQASYLLITIWTSKFINLKCKACKSALKHHHLRVMCSCSVNIISQYL